MELNSAGIKKFFVVSVCLNIVLVVAIGASVFCRHPSSSLPAPRKNVPFENTPSFLHPSSSDLETVSSESAFTETNQEGWIAQLQASGAPQCALVAAVLADFDQRWKKRSDEAGKRYRSGEISEKELAMLGIEQEIVREQEIRNILGEEGFVEWDKARQLAELDGLHLSEAEKNKAYALRRKLIEEGRKLERSRLVKEVDQATYEKLYGQLEDKYCQQIQEMVGPERYGNLEPGDAPITPEERRGMRLLDVDATKVAAVEQAGRDLNKELADLETKNLDPTEYLKQYEALRQEKEIQVRELLGADTYEAYKKKSDSRYMEMTDYASDWGLSGSDIDYVYNVLAEYDKTLLKCRLLAAGTLSESEINANLQQFTTQVSQVLKEHLGDERFETLKKNRIILF